MEPTTQSRSHAKDVFLNLASVVTLYASAVALLNLLFSVINKAYPQTIGYYSPSISLPVATLIVVFPLYILFMWLIEKDVMSVDGGRMTGIRKWLTYITLFISGGLIVGDLVTILYYFLDGRDVTAGFILKVISILVVAGGVFGYYITDARSKMTTRVRKVSVVLSSLVILGAIVIGFSVLGSPRTQRLANYDDTKISNLQNISNQVSSYYQRNKVLPVSIDVLSKDPYSYYYAEMIDPQTQEMYVYRVINESTYELCATFNLDARDNSHRSYYGGVWGEYTAGEYCFTQIVSPLQ